MSVKTIDGLMRHLRNSGIDINGSKQKQQLRNVGYFHGYKGYRFFKNSARRLPFVTFSEIYATIQYDTKLKVLFYDKVMLIETAVKNIALECILDEIHSWNIQDMYSKIVTGYNNMPVGSSPEQRKKAQQSKLNLQGMIHSYIIKGYRNGNPQITHFYNNINYGEVPLWALFEVIMLGDFGFLLSCLTYDMRDKISKKLNLNIGSDTNRELIYKFLYALKDIRNAIAHNAVVFDTRFRKIEPTKSMKRCLEQEFNLNYINFKTIDDYVILVAYYLKILGISKKEIKIFINEFERITEGYVKAVNINVSSVVVHSKIKERMEILRQHI